MSVLMVQSSIISGSCSVRSAVMISIPAGAGAVAVTGEHSLGQVGLHPPETAAG
jgi:hypothetical protein